MESGSWAELKEAGNKHYQVGEYTEATKCLRRAAEMVPTNAETWIALGFAYQADGNVAEAIGAFKTAIGLDPQNPESFFGIGLSYKSNADFQRAITSFDEALTIRPNHTRARDELIKTLVQDGKIKVGSNDEYHGEISLERAYKLARNSPETVLPFVGHLIGVHQHKKAFDVINQALKEEAVDPQIKALANRMDNDPKLAHAKQLATLRAEPKQLTATPAKPLTNPDEVACPCGAARVMKWAVVCPTCNNRIGAQQGSSFSGHEHISATTWIDVAYYVISILWLLYGGALIALGGEDFGQYFMIIGILNASVALGLLFQVEWIQFVGKILMLLNLLGGIIRAFMSLGLSDFLGFGIGVAVIALAGFSMWVIGQMSD